MYLYLSVNTIYKHYIYTLYVYTVFVYTCLYICIYIQEKAASTFGRIWKGLKFIPSVPTFVMWMRAHPMTRTKIAVQCYCYGGETVLKAAPYNADLIKCFVSTHPAKVQVPAEIDAFKQPALVQFPATDFQWSSDGM